MSIPTGSRLWCPMVMLLSGCLGATDRPNGADPYFAPTDETLVKHEVPSFEEFEAATRVGGTADELYLVEWDLPIQTEAELRTYYEQRFSGNMLKSAVKLTPSTGPDTLQCNVNPPPANCIDDRFYNGEQRTLRYCVSDGFGADKAQMVTAMSAAALAWRGATNASFTYVSTHDASCSQTDPVPADVTFKVAPWTVKSEGGACSFWPYSGRSCVPGTLVWDSRSFLLPSQTLTGVMTHELGHILGLHHEHERADVATASCATYEMRYLTDWDPNSIMGYPTAYGGCSIGGGDTLTEKDGIGIRRLYGVPPAWITAMMM